MAETQQVFYGWYDDATQTEPTYEPPRGGPCLFCGGAITPGDVRTHSIMAVGEYARRSYFYRTHRTCAEHDKSPNGMDDFIFDMIRRNGD